MLNKKLLSAAVAVGLLTASCGSAGSEAGSTSEPDAATTDQVSGATAETEAADTEAESDELEAPEETTGLTVEFLHQWELGAQLPELDGFDFRARKITFESGGATDAHNHDDRPGVLYVLEGEVTEIRNGEAQVFTAGESWVEGTDANHWVLNHTDEDAVVITADLVETSDDEVEQLGEDTGTEIELESEPPTEASGIEPEELGLFDVGDQIEGADGIQLRLRQITFEPEAAFPSHSHAVIPGFGYVLEGDFTEIRPDKARTITAGETWFEDAGTEHWLTNLGDEPTTILVADLLREEE